jgi:hypothetical protein
MVTDVVSLIRELAELFGGQAKPPTVSKEEIDKSGLEVIKATAVPQYETDGKISSNCTERVSPMLAPDISRTLPNDFPSVSFVLMSM